MNLYLDDLRDPKKYGRPNFIWVKDAKSAIALFKTGKVTFASLDHDLAPDQYNVFTRFDDDSTYKDKTGMAVLYWIKDHNLWPKNGIEIHSSNINKRLEMINFCKKYLPDDKVFVKIYQRTV